MNLGDAIQCTTPSKESLTWDVRSVGSAWLRGGRQQVGLAGGVCPACCLLGKQVQVLGWGTSIRVPGQGSCRAGVMACGTPSPTLCVLTAS